MLNRLFRAGLVTMATLVLTTSSAFAATLPTITSGMRGQDVALMQRLLTYGGQPVAITELYGPTTQGLVKKYQAQHGLSADGIVGNNTWRSLMPWLARGSKGVAVVGLQTELNIKYQAGLSVDGQFGAATEQAVRSFQAHLGLPATGTVDDNTWVALVSHFEQLPLSGPGWYRYGTINGDGAWGESHAMAVFKQVAQQWKAQGYSARIGVGDISLVHGGVMPDHASHQRGVDFDLTPMRSDGREGRVTRFDAVYSRSVTQRLVDMLWATGEVEVIFFNDPNVKGVTYWPNHDNHLHVRFRR